jgi:hypothetical protein
MTKGVGRYERSEGYGHARRRLRGGAVMELRFATGEVFRLGKTTIAHPLTPARDPDLKGMIGVMVVARSSILDR